MTSSELQSEDVTFLGLSGANDASNLYSQILYWHFGETALLDDLSAELGLPNRTLEDVLESRTVEGLHELVLIGAGFSNPYSFEASSENVRVVSVRGFLTRNRIFDATSHVGVGDLGYLCKQLETFRSTDSGETVLVLDSVDGLDDHGLKERYGEFDHLVLLSDPLSDIVERIQHAAFVYSDHVLGLSIADALGTPHSWLNSCSASASTKFEVRDHYSVVGKDYAGNLRRIPVTDAGKRKHAYLTSRQKVEEIYCSLRNVIQGYLESLKLLKYVDLIDVPMYVNDELRFQLEIEDSSPWFKLDYQYQGASLEKQYLVSYLLEIDEGALDDDGRITGLSRSRDPEIGFYRYLKLERGSSSKVISIDLPEGVTCTGFKLKKWNDDAAPLLVDSLKTRVTNSV